MTAKYKFIEHLFATMQRTPKLVLFYDKGVPIYSFTRLSKEGLRYELLHIKSKRYLELVASGQALPRLRNKMFEMLLEVIDKVDILYPDQTTQTYETDEV